MVAPVVPTALAVSTEDAPATSDGSSAVVDPDNLMNQFVNPTGDTGGDATIAVPAIQVPGEDSDDYLPPDSDDDSDDGVTSRQSD